MPDSIRVTCFFAPLLLLAVSAGAQEGDGSASNSAPKKRKPPCATPEHRQFDFWLGTWDVHNRAQPKRPPARNVITAEHDGCLIHEQYVAGLYNGSSLNFYNPQTKRWHQTWIDNQGGSLLLDGGLDKKGRMVLSSDPSKSPIERITWTPKKNGDVRQHWQQSKDGGKTWADVFDGTYVKVK